MGEVLTFLKEFFSHFSFEETISSFIIMFMVIDMVGLTPIIIDMRQKGREINPTKAACLSLIMFLAFLFLGSSILGLFHVDVCSFAIGGSIVLFLMAVEMVLDIEIFRNNGPAGASTMVPLVFPLIAGAGSFTTLLSLQSMYGLVNILIGLLLNIIIVYLVLRNMYLLERILGKSGVYVTRKFFGVMLLAVSFKMFLDNLVLFIGQV
ncbi:MAG: MarC family protein, partial [Bacteroidales bacterium]|nr:MarC family protein [Bacteroidales bacterium]